MKKEDPCMEKVENDCPGYKIKCNLDLLDYRKKTPKLQHKWSEERQNTIFKKCSGFPQWENVCAVESNKSPVPLGLFPTVLNQSLTEPPCDCCPAVLFSNL